MNDIKYFYADPAGTVHENPQVWPLAVLANRYPKGIVLRFAYDRELDKIYIQDQNIRRLMGSGDRDVWHYVNEAAKFVKREFGAGFLDREFGDPPGTAAKRNLSQYAKAWQYLNDYLSDEIGVPPVNMTVCEFVPDGNRRDPVSLEIAGSACGEGTIDEPSIHINRYMHKEGLSESEDVDWDLLNETLARFYLRNVREIHDIAAGEDHSGLLDRYEDALGYELMVAYAAGGDVKIIRASDNGLSEQEVRRAVPNAEGVTLFSYIPEQKRLVFHNRMPTDMAGKEGLSDVLASITKLAARSSNARPDDIVVSFDPALNAPFVTKMGRYKIPSELGKDRFGKDLGELAVVEVPIGVPRGAMLVRKSSEEPDRLKDFRVRFGLAVDYPFLAVDNRTHSLGGKYRAMLDALAKPSGEGKKASRWIERDREFVSEIRSEEQARKVQRQMEFMLRMGMPRTYIVDFYAGRQDPPKRAEYRMILRKAWDKAGIGTRRYAASKTAAIGPAYDVNSWWHIGLQEELNRAQHDSADQRQALEPYNMRKIREHKGPKKKPYEALLNPQRDKDLGYMKTTEQLLRESRI